MKESKLNYTIFIREIKMPATVRAFTVPDEDGNFNVYINECLSEEAKRKSLDHEKMHISRDDFIAEAPARLIEATL